MFRLLLDEGISPSISSLLWAEGIDNYPLRDRGLLGLSDHEIWALANAQGRAVVTINGADFRQLARRADDHAGLMIIPSGGTRHEHFRFVMLGIEHARSMSLDALRNVVIQVPPFGEGL